MVVQVSKGRRVQGKKQVGVRQLLEWAFQRERAQLDFDGEDRSGAVALPSFGMEYLLLERARVGCSIDGGGRSDPHHDADLVAAALSVLPEARGGRRMAVQIAELARAGLAPDCMLDAKPRVEPVEWRQCKHGMFAKAELVQVIRYHSRGRIREFKSNACPIRYRNNASEIAAARRNYLGWWSALNELRASFQQRPDLISFEVNDDMPIMLPWKEG